MKPYIRLGTRASALARWQADWVAGQLQTRGVEVETVPITTQGDTRQGPLGSLGSVGLFTKEIQRALLEEQIDIAVHSLKDLPTDPVDGLILAASPAREMPGDALVSTNYEGWDELPAGARIGTGSIRRRAQLLHWRRDLEMLDIRGNVDTRLRKLEEGDYDAIVLAEAGLTRLGLAEHITERLPMTRVLPAVGQGALGIEARQADQAALDIVRLLDDADTHAAVVAERAMLATLRGGCLAPVGAWARVVDGALRMEGVVLSEDGAQRIAVSRESSPRDAESLGRTIAGQLLAAGAAELISASRG